MHVDARAVKGNRKGEKCADMRAQYSAAHQPRSSSLALCCLCRTLHPRSGHELLAGGFCVHEDDDVARGDETRPRAKRVQLERVLGLGKGEKKKKINETGEEGKNKQGK